MPSPGPWSRRGGVEHSPFVVLLSVSAVTRIQIRKPCVVDPSFCVAFNEPASAVRRSLFFESTAVMGWQLSHPSYEYTQLSKRGYDKSRAAVPSRLRLFSQDFASEHPGAPTERCCLLLHCLVPYGFLPPVSYFSPCERLSGVTK